MDPDDDLEIEDSLQDSEISIDPSVDASLPEADCAVWSDKQHQPNETMFFLFKFYNPQLKDLVRKLQCYLKIQMGFYVVGGKSPALISQCLQSVKREVSKVLYICLQNKHTYSSGTIHRMAKDKQAELAIFNGFVYLVSNLLSRQELMALAEAIDCLSIFSVKILNQRQEGTLSHPIATYFQAVMDPYKDVFLEKAIQVEVSLGKTKVNVIGRKPSSLMYAKNILINVRDSAVCFFANGPSYSDVRKLQKYVSAICKNSTVLCSLIGKNRLLVIGKDNILKQLIKTEKFRTLALITADTELGIFMLPSPSLQSKMHAIKNICLELAIDTYRKAEYTFFRKIIEESGPPLYEVLSSVIEQASNNKNRVEVFQQKQKFNDNIEPESNFRKEGKVKEKQLSELLKRDVLMEAVIVSRQIKVAYEMAQGNSVKVYWRQDDASKTKLEETTLGKGVYVRGMRKEEGEKAVYLVEAVIHVL